MPATEPTALKQSIPVDQIRYNEQGLVPAIVQDYLDGTVLMMAWMNRESLHKTLETGETWFWSRSRQELWHKGASSGHLQKVRSLRMTAIAMPYSSASNKSAILPAIQVNVAVFTKSMGKS